MLDTGLIVLKLSYLCGLILNIFGLVTGAPRLRRVPLLLCPAVLVLLILVWRAASGGWASYSYAFSVCVALVLSLCGDLLLNEPPEDSLVFTGFAFYLIALCCYASALSSTSKPPRSTQVSQTGGRIVRLGAAVPIRIFRAIPVSAAVATVAIIWRLADGAGVLDDSRYAAAVCTFLAQALLLWRALARVGYQASLITVSGLLKAAKRRRAIGADIELQERGGQDAPDGDGASRPRQETNEEPDAFAYVPSDSDGEGDDGISGMLGLSGAGASPLRYGIGANAQMVKRGAKLLAAQQRRERNRRQAQREMSALESRWWQWCGVVGAACVGVGVAALGYDRLWLNFDDADSNGYPSVEATWLTYVHTLATWVGHTLLAASVPCALPPTGSLDHPAVAPRPTDGPPHRVVILLPSDGYDIAEVAVPWFNLVRRGHSVAFATRDGLAGLQLTGRLPVPWDASVHGYGCGCRPAAGRGCLAALCPASVRGACGCRAGKKYVRFPGAGVAVLVESGLPQGDRRSRRGASGNALCCGPNRSVLCCGSDLCSFAAVGVGIGAPSPLIAAMYRDLLEDAAFRRPLAWSRSAVREALQRLPKRYRARLTGRRSRRRSRQHGLSPAGGKGDGSGSGSDRDGSTHSSGSDVDAGTNPTDLLLLPDSYDGLIVVGCHPAATHDHSAVWSEVELQQIVAGFWGTGKPVGVFSNAVLLLARALDKSGRPLIASVPSTAGLSSAVERGSAMLLGLLRCSWRPFVSLLRGQGRGGMPSVQDAVTGVYEQFAGGDVPAKDRYITGPSPFRPSAVLRSVARSELTFVRPATPFVTGGGPPPTVVVEHGRYFSAQGGADAFALTRSFMTKLEEVARTF